MTSLWNHTISGAAGRAIAYATSAIGLGSCSTTTSARSRRTHSARDGVMDTAPTAATRPTRVTATPSGRSWTVRLEVLSTSARGSTPSPAPLHTASSTVSMPPRSGG